LVGLLIDRQNAQDLALGRSLRELRLVNRRSIFSVAGLPLLTLLDPEKAEAESISRHHKVLLPLDAIADGTSHPLSSRFSSLTMAREVYPHASSLSDEIDWCALQGTINDAATQGGGAVYVPNPGTAYVLNRGLAVNPNRVSLRGDGSILDFRTMTTGGSAILMSGDAAPMYGHERFVLEGFELFGPGHNTHIAGILFQTTTPGLSSRSQIRDCVIHDFLWGVLFGNRAYAIGFSHVSVYNCVFGVHAPYGLTDAGEMISFSQCYFFNSYCLISNSAGFDMKFLACAFDNGERTLWDNNGSMEMVGCRITMSPQTVPPIHCAGGCLNIFGGFIIVNGSHDAVQTQEFFSLSRPSASVNLFSVLGWNWRTTTGKLTNGPGKVRWYEGTEINEPPPGIGSP
jgi:hypothetical protein